MTFFPDRMIVGDSETWKNWVSVLSITTCLHCLKNHGKIFHHTEITEIHIPAHPNCMCTAEYMRTKTAGTATKLGMNGADAYLSLYGILPNYYVSKEFAENHGWVNWKGNLDEVLPGKMIGGNIYKNIDHKLPDFPGRVWYEADINYEYGYRNNSRILYSNDGLIFVSYDHYKTFYEITERS